ncbi:MAG: alcohol dehydrogenase catalytic domain-containing protein [Desulfobacterales bacterium]|nr:MAG: alcohol dehydrogenase catalytic domain-containing protein [Desulfobacterales bacterium]
MKAIVFNGPYDFALKEIENPSCAADEVEIKVHMAGICGSDLALLHGRNPSVPYPIVPGHECMGKIVRTPADSTFKAGDRVTVFPAFGCRKCAACNAGHIPHCPQAKTVGVLRPGGCFTERIVAHTERVFLLPEQVEDDVGAMVEPTAVAVHANRRAALAKGAKIVVIGGGTIGLLIAQVAQAYGAQSVVVSEPNAGRQSLARQSGLDLICNPQDENLVDFVRDRIGMPDAVFDVVGSELTVKQSTELLRPNGLLILIAMPHGEGPGIPYHPIFQKELNVIGSRTYFWDDFTEAIQLLSDRRVRVRPMISEKLPLSRFAEGVELLEKQPEKYVKILISPLM